VKYQRVGKDGRRVSIEPNGGPSSEQNDKD
jgi:hypothetical protein